MTQSQPRVHEVALEILRATKDGDELSPKDLKLVELTVNGMVNAAGRAEFFALLDRVRAGYIPEPFHGIAHMTYDQQGYVRWKGQVIEHFCGSYAYTGEAAVYARQLAKRCQQLEAKGEQLSMRSVVWAWCDDSAKP